MECMRASLSRSRCASGSKHLGCVQTAAAQVTFGADYPMVAPECVWVPPAPVHSHIYSNGHICLDILYEGGRGTWSPALTVASVARSLESMLLQATARDRVLPPGDADYVARVGGRSSRETVCGAVCCAAAF